MKCLPAESGILGFGIRIRKNAKLRLKTGIQAPRTRHLDSITWNLESNTVLDYMYLTCMSQSLDFLLARVS